MKKIVGHLIVLSLLCLINVNPARAWDADRRQPQSYELQQKYIHSFRQNAGFIHTERNDSIALLGDSLTTVLDSIGKYDEYFELKRVVIRSHILRGESRIAVAQSDMMYSKAQAMNHKFGMAMSLSAIGEVYSHMNRLEEAGTSLEEALKQLKDPSDNQILTKILLMQLVDNLLHLKNIGKAKLYIERINEYLSEDLSPVEQALFYNYNAYYCIQAGMPDEADNYLKEAWKLEPMLPVGIIRHLLITEAAYYESKEEYEKALDVYDRFFKGKAPQSNRGLYIDAMRNKAELYVMMGKEQEAFKQFANVYAYVKSVFNKNYPKEIDRLCTRFQADRLKFMNEHRRTLSNRYYVTGIAVCVLVLFYLIFLSWKKIFKLKESKRKQEEMRRKAENAIRKKNMFLSNMSHEVRTPLNAIVGFSTLLASEEDMGMDDDSRKQACEIIRVNSHQLLKLINDILDLSDFEEDNIHFNMKEHDAVKICNEVIETIRASYKLNVRLEFETALASLKLETDDSRLRQVLINLLVNAVKFTKEGSVVLKLEKANDGTALFSVADTGCGIPKEKQKLIFERFEKLNEFVQGTGLGLSICRMIVDHLGGEMGVESEIGKGSTFWFTFPYKAPEKPVREDVIFEKIKVEKDKLTVLIAEDNAGNFKLFETILKNDYTIVHAWNGKEAVELFKEYEPHIVLMDINMPEMNGYEATKEIRKLSEVIPIIAVTAYAFASDEEQVMNSGFDAYASKPLNASALKKQMVDLLRARVFVI